MDLVPRVKAALGTHPYGFPITPGDAGWPHARLVQHVTIDDDLSVWIGTSRRSRKGRGDPALGHATYAVEDRASVAAVMLSGQPTIEARADQRITHWDDGFRAFFPAGPASDDYTLVRLAPDEIELIDFAPACIQTPAGSSHSGLP